jgi:serine/threonine-protein kinase
MGKCIGRGQQGRVMRAEVASQELAVKLVDNSATQFAHTERDALSLLVHPGIVALYNYAEDSNQAYIVLELVPGEDLFHFMRRERLPLGEVRRVAAQVVLALEYIHSSGFIYRDLKPENVMVLPSGAIKLIDFGLAKRMTETGLLQPQGRLSTWLLRL